MELIIFTGVQGAGKTTFYRHHFAATHRHVTLDRLKKRHREWAAVEACLEAGDPFVVDNTNTLPEERARYIAPARAEGYRVVSYLFDVPFKTCLARNAERSGKARIPDAGLRMMARRLVTPALEEGFDALYRVDVDGAASLIEGRAP